MVQSTETDVCLACTLWHCQRFPEQGSIAVGVNSDDEAVVASDHLAWCMTFCIVCPAFASQQEQKKPSSAPPMCHTLEITRCTMSHAADMGIQRLAHTRQNLVKQDKIVHLQLTIAPQWHPVWLAEALTRRRKVSLMLIPACTACVCNWGSWNALLPR